MAAREANHLSRRVIQAVRFSISRGLVASRLAPALRLGIFLGLIFCLSLGAAEEDGQFLFLTLRYKDGIITVVKSAMVSGTIKPQRNSTKTDALHITLEKAEGETAWSLAIDDPSVRRYEYEDPQQPGVIRTKEVKVNDIEFIVRAPLVAGVRHLTVYRQEPPSPGAKPSAAPVKKLLLRHALPQEVTR
jgi:hypothetical protein